MKEKLLQSYCWQNTQWFHWQLRHKYSLKGVFNLHVDWYFEFKKYILEEDECKKGKIYFLSQYVQEPDHKHNIVTK